MFKQVMKGLRGSTLKTISFEEFYAAYKADLKAKKDKQIRLVYTCLV